MNKGDYQRIQHIQRYCKDIGGFIARFGSDFDTFTHDRVHFNAISMCILQIGKLSNGLSLEFREETKEQMPWDMIRGMRKWFAHAYTEMDETIIWETAMHVFLNYWNFVIVDWQESQISKWDEPSCLSPSAFRETPQPDP